MNDLHDPPTDDVELQAFLNELIGRSAARDNKARDVAAVAAGTAITCPACGMTSHNKHDVRERYCANCHWFTSDPLLRHLAPRPRGDGE